jgi:hypothetical protein
MAGKGPTGKARAKTARQKMRGAFSGRYMIFIRESRIAQKQSHKKLPVSAVILLFEKEPFIQP